MATITGLGGSQVTGYGGGSMDPADLQRLQQQDPTLFQRLANFLGLGAGGNPVTPGNRITGDVGSVTRGGVNITGGGEVGPVVTGSGATNIAGGGGATLGGATPGGGSSIPNMGARGAAGGAGGAGGGGGGRPPTTGAGAPAPEPNPRGSGPGINLAGMRDRARASQLGQDILKGTGRTTLRGGALALAGRYSPLIGGGLALMQGDLVGAAGSAVGGILGSALGPVGSIVGATIGGGAAKALTGGAAKAVEAVTGQRREEGKSGVMGGGIPNLSAKDMEVVELLRRGGVKTAEEMLPLYRQYRGVELQNQMQLNQQLGQLTGALNRQQYTAQLAGGAQQQAGQTVRDILASSNPYAASVFRAG